MHACGKLPPRGKHFRAIALFSSPSVAWHKLKVLLLREPIAKMQIILKESFRYFVVQGSAIILATIFSCYGIAVSLGHVPVWLPMISDCGVYAPEKYLFSYGLITGAVFAFAEAVLLYHAEGKAFSNSRISLIFSLMSSLGMGVVGAVSEKENLKVHTSTLRSIISYRVTCFT